MRQKRKSKSFWKNLMGNPMPPIRDDDLIARYIRAAILRHVAQDVGRDILRRFIHDPENLIRGDFPLAVKALCAIYHANELLQQCVNNYKEVDIVPSGPAFDLLPKDLILDLVNRAARGIGKKQAAFDANPKAGGAVGYRFVRLKPSSVDIVRRKIALLRLVQSN